MVKKVTDRTPAEPGIDIPTPRKPKTSGGSGPEPDPTIVITTTPDEPEIPTINPIQPDSPMVASLKDVKSLVDTIKSGDLDELLTGIGVLADSDCSNMCGCVNSMCGCNGGVTALGADLTKIPDFIELRKNRMDELRNELSELEQMSKRIDR